MSMYDEQESLVGGGMIRTAPSGHWDLGLPSGKHIRGRAETQEAARQAAIAEHKTWVYGQWQKGSSGHRQSFHVPLK